MRDSSEISIASEVPIHSTVTMQTKPKAKPKLVRLTAYLDRKLMQQLKSALAGDGETVQAWAEEAAKARIKK